MKQKPVEIDSVLITKESKESLERTKAELTTLDPDKDIALAHLKGEFSKRANP